MERLVGKRYFDDWIDWAWKIGSITVAFLNSLDSDLYLLQYLLLIANTADKIVSFYVFIDVIVSLRKYRKFKEKIDHTVCFYQLAAFLSASEYKLLSFITRT